MENKKQKEFMDELQSFSLGVIVGSFILIISII